MKYQVGPELVSLAFWQVVLGLVASSTILGQGYRPLDDKLPGVTNPDYARRVRLFAPFEYQEQAGQRSINFRLFVPRAVLGQQGNVDALAPSGGVSHTSAKSAAQGEEFPLFVWFHGAGESGDDNYSQLAYIKDEVESRLKENGDFACFVVVSQCPKSEPSWNGEQLGMTLRLAEKVGKDWPIDSQRIYGLGVSSGGSACWKAGMLRPDLFAALSPMASAGLNESSVEPLSRIPIWAFHVAEDRAPTPEGVRRTVAAVRNAGGDCWLTETQGRGHNCWKPALNEYQVVDWLMQQRQGSSTVSIPAHAKWEARFAYLRTIGSWWPQGIGLIVLVGIAFLLVREYRRRKGIVATNVGGEL